MEVTWFSLAWPPLLLVPAMGLLSRSSTRRALGPEIRRKLLHVGTGLLALSFPLYLQSTWLVGLTLVLIVSWMLAVRMQPSLRSGFGRVLHDADRRSYGELYYAVAIALLLIAARDAPLLYVVPVLILTFADAGAAIAGQAMPRGALPGPARGKTLTGSVAFCLIAFLTCWISLVAIAGTTATLAMLIASATAIVTTITEAVSRRGLDNLTVPVVCYLTLLSSGVAIA